jgi:hypothetical protein
MFAAGSFASGLESRAARRRVKTVAAAAVLAASFLLAASKKPPVNKEENKPQAQSAVNAPLTRKALEVLSPFDEPLFLPLLKFIDAGTGLSCRQVKLEGGNRFSEYEYDLYMGPMPKLLPEGIDPLESSSWKSLGPSLSEGGVHTWSTWHGCLALNTILPLDNNGLETNALGALVGKLTAVNPDRDLFTLAILTALSSAYGTGILQEISNAIPACRGSREELVFSLESGQYAGAIGAAGFFRRSALKGYPIEVRFSSLNRAKYPVTAVYGKNVAFIPAASRNKEGAAYLIAFLAQRAFQEHLAGGPGGKATGGSSVPVLLPFDPIDPEALAKTGWKAEYPPQKDFIEWTYDWGALEEARKAWEAAAYPEGMRDILK